MNLSHWILLFFIYACLGWGGEVAFAALKEGRFINRGFLNGPICPIYGFGVISVVLALRPVQDSLLLLYAGSVLFTSVMELVTGWALEKLFHARWWDYSDMPLNLMGHVCLVFSLLWGAACVAVVRGLHPLFVIGVTMLPAWALWTLDGLFGATFLFDLCATVVAVRRLSDRLARLTEAAGELHAISDELGQTIFNTTQSTQERLMEGVEAMQDRRDAAKEHLEKTQRRVGAWFHQQRDLANARTEALRRRFNAVTERITRLLEEKGFIHRRLLSAFPNLRSLRYQEALETLRRFYKRHRESGDSADGH